jgi:glycerophosphoryl diester phosphodiesterase
MRTPMRMPATATTRMGPGCSRWRACSRRSSTRAPGRAGIAGPAVAAVRDHPDLVERAHARGREVYVWTVNEPDETDLVRRLGVDGIITGRPAAVLSQLGR